MSSQRAFAFGEAWARVDLNHRPIRYERSALTS